MTDDLHSRRALRTARQGAAVAQPGAITSVVAAGAAPTKAEYDALRQDVVNLRTTLAALITSNKNAGQIG
jgi:hypothetical protein